MLAAERVKVFWQPGCTSCLRTKEFLTKSGVDYESINVHGNPAGMEELRKLGARSVPVVARGGKFVFAQALGDVIEFLDLKVQVHRSRRSGSTSPFAIATGRSACCAITCSGSSRDFSNRCTTAAS